MRISSVNDWYSVDPRVFATSKELKFFLESFGHHTGRYMLTLPLSWQEIVRDHLSDARPIESQRIREILAIGMKRGAIWKHPKVPKKFTAEKWIGQAAEFYGVAPELIEAFVADDFDLGGDSTPENMPAVSYSDFDVSSNRSEEISTHPAEYLRVAETLLLASQEVVFVDPYLNPSDEKRASVLKNLLMKLAARSAIKSVVIWVREREAGTRQQYLSVLKEIIRELPSGDLTIRVFAVEDGRSKDRLHARYLLSIKGAIQFDLGFIEMDKKTTIVTPVPMQVHKDLVIKYISGQNDLKLVWQLSIN